MFDLEPRGYFTRLALFAHFYFAAVPGLVDDAGGGGGDDGGGDEGGGDAGDDGTDVGEDESGVEGEDEGDGADGADDSSETDDDADGGEGERGKDGKKVPPDVNAALKKMREVDPKMADVLRKEHYQLGDFRKVGTLDEVRAMKETFDDIGGEEGVQVMRGKVANYATELMHFAEGNPQAVEDLFNDYPEGGFKLVPIAVNKMRALETDETTGLPKSDGRYAHLQARLTAESWEMYGAAAVLEDVLRIAHDGGANAQQRTIEKLSILKRWADGVRAFARTRPTGDDAQGKGALDKEKQEIAQEKRGIYLTKVGSAVTTHMNAVISRYLNPKLREYQKLTGKPLKTASKQDVFIGISTRMSKALETNSRYQSAVKSMLAENADPEKIGRFCRTYMEKLAQKATDGVWEVKGHGNARRGKAAAAGAAGGSGQARTVTGKKPSADKIDWSKDPSRMRFIRGEATLKKEHGGHVVKWDATAL